MKQTTQNFETNGAIGAARSISGRELELSAPARCACYGAWSTLVASPHDIDARASLGEKIGAGATIDYASQLDALLQEYVETDIDVLKREYSSVFEVGSDGPPSPIREDLQTGRRAGTREDVVRFYSFFNYSLDEKFAWAPDHLSVELEFMHYLCYREATSAGEALSYQLAQADFSERHLCRWVPSLAASVESNAPGSLFSRIVAEMHAFTRADYDWQCTTIVKVDEGPQQ